MDPVLPRLHSCHMCFLVYTPTAMCIISHHHLDSSPLGAIHLPHTLCIFTFTPSGLWTANNLVWFRLGEVSFHVDPDDPSLLLTNFPQLY